MAEAVYVLCCFTSVACAGFLLRAHCQNHTQLLLWSSVCFALLGLSNALLVMDLIIWPSINLYGARTFVTLLGLLALVYGLIAEEAART